MNLSDLYAIIPKLEKLEDRWDSYKAKKPTEQTIKRYKKLIDNLNSFNFNFDLIRDAGPIVSVRGGVGLTIIKDDLEYVIEITDLYNLITKISNDELLEVVSVKPAMSKLISQLRKDGIIQT